MKTDNADMRDDNDSPERVVFHYHRHVVEIIVRGQLTVSAYHT